MDDPETQKPVPGLAGFHGTPVISQKGSWQSSLLERLNEAVNKLIGTFPLVPLNVAAKAGTVIKDAQCFRLVPLSL